MDTLAVNSAFRPQSRALSAVAWGAASLAALITGTLAAVSVGGGQRLLVGLAGFAAYVILFARAAGEFHPDDLVWDYPDSTLLRSGAWPARRAESREI